ncbi:hypothetical protein CCR75_001890 [Bremia lactucae]|uniref:Uncharacterized protein n=1 Tax=Bremia lactucae TaxID=4779 RepID=A0A976FIW1_BRELC|nr:hypothetical protein CCR75_001890 [Bremia lactucae]
MFASKFSYKSAQTRFNLLLLEDGEFFLDDFSVHRYLEPHPDTHRKVQGRLKMGTRGFFFEPQDSNLPILRFFFRDMKEMPMAELHNHPEAGECAILLAFTVSSIVEMKERGVDHPYVSKDTRGNATVPEKYLFSLLHSKMDEFLKIVRPIWTLAHQDSVMNKVDEEALLAPVLSPRQTDQFDSSLLVDFRERPLLLKGKFVDRIVPLLKYPGCLMLTNQRLYFQPAQVNNVGDPVLNWAYHTIEYVYKRRHMLKQSGLECFLKNGESFFFSFRNHTDRDEVYARMVTQPDLKHLQETEMIELMLRRWQQREVSNFEYLVYLNNAAGRTKNDLTQYPVFPWILSDYDSPSIDLRSSAVYRDLSKPIGALNQERLEFYKARYDAMPRDMEDEGLPPPFLYGTHYSTPGYVLYYFVRMAPEYMLCLQNGKFDAPDRLFQSISSTWSSCNTNHADLKELVPAFFDESVPPDEWLCNGKNLDLGTTQKLTRVGNVELPAWASSPSDFVRINREALESEYVSEHLHEWIDLIFGFKQRGPAAIDANNRSVDLETITDPVEKCSLEAQIQEFGQTPTLLFAGAHPSRNDRGNSIVLATPDVVRPLEKLKSTGFLTSNEGNDQVLEEMETPEPPTYDESCDETGTGHRRGRFAFRTRSFTAVPKQAQRFVGGLTAQIRRRMSVESSPRWNWAFGTTGDASLWAPSVHYMLHTGEVTSLVLGKDGRALFSTSKDAMFKVTATLDGTLRRTLMCNLALSCCDVSPDEKYVFIGSWDNCIYMYSMDVGRVIDQISAHDDGLSAICVVDDRVLSSSWDGSIKLWQYTHKGLATVPLLTFMECEESVVKLCVGSDGVVAAAATKNGLVYLIDLRTCELIRKLIASPIHQAEICGLTFCGGTSTIACMTTANELSVYHTDGTRIVTIHVAVEGLIRYIFVFLYFCNGEALFKTIFGRSFDSDGDVAVGGTSTGKLLFWKLDEPLGREQVLEIPDAHTQGISALTVSTYGSALVSASCDGGIRIWQLRRKTASRARLPAFF